MRNKERLLSVINEAAETLNITLNVKKRINKIMTNVSPAELNELDSDKDIKSAIKKLSTLQAKVDNIK